MKAKHLTKTDWNNAVTNSLEKPETIELCSKIPLMKPIFILFSDLLLMAIRKKNEVTEGLFFDTASELAEGCIPADIQGVNRFLYSCSLFVFSSMIYDEFQETCSNK